eukprot:Sspe_Gene.90717::Locus_62212_Transcript_1_1_Confidence_1.000_Length_4508::g.90717::m.90717
MPQRGSARGLSALRSDLNVPDPYAVTVETLIAEGAKDMGGTLWRSPFRGKTAKAASENALSFAAPTPKSPSPNLSTSPQMMSPREAAAAVRAKANPPAHPILAEETKASAKTKKKKRPHPEADDTVQEERPVEAFDTATYHWLTSFEPGSEIAVNAQSLGLCVTRMNGILKALTQSTRLMSHTQKTGANETGPQNDEQQNYIRQLIQQSELFLHDIKTQQQTIKRLEYEEGRTLKILADYKEEFAVLKQLVDSHDEVIRAKDARIAELEERLEAASTHAMKVETKLSNMTKRPHPSSPLWMGKTPLARMQGLRTRSFERETSMKKQVNAPTGQVTLLFTDIQGSTRLWEYDSAAMKQCLFIHNRVVRKAVERYQGYEVKTVGDAFMLAFHDPKHAMACALLIQLELLNQNWPAAFEDHPDCFSVTLSPRPTLDVVAAQTEKQDDPLHVPDGHTDSCLAAVPPYLWHGVRVRMGINMGRPICQIDPITSRMDYFGPCVNKSARIEAAAIGGMIACTPEVADAVRPHAAALGYPTIETHDFTSLKGIGESVEIMRVVPCVLEGRMAEFASVVEKIQAEQEKRKRQAKREELEEQIALRGELNKFRLVMSGSSTTIADEELERLEEELRYLDEVEGGTAIPVEEKDALLRGLPRGSVAVVFCRVANHHDLRKQVSAHPERWQQILLTYTGVLQRTADESESPFVRFEEEKAMLVFATPEAALLWCLKVQERLMDEPWPDDIDSMPFYRPAKWRGVLVQRGVRVQMGVHMCEAEPAVDPFSKKAAYLGDDVASASTLASNAVGGQIVISEPVYHSITEHLSSLGMPVVNFMGALETPPVGKKNVYQVFPRHLVGRMFLLMGFNDKTSTPSNEEYQNFKRTIIAEEARRLMAEQGPHSPPEGKQMQSVLKAFGRDLRLLTIIQSAVLHKIRREADGDDPLKGCPTHYTRQLEHLEAHRMAAEDTRMSEDMYLTPAFAFTLADVSTILEHAIKTRATIRSRRPMSATGSDRSSVRSDLSDLSELGTTKRRKKRIASGYFARGTAKRAKNRDTWKSETRAHQRDEAEARRENELVSVLKQRLQESLNTILVVHKHVRFFCDHLRVYLEQFADTHATRSYTEDDLIINFVNFHREVYQLLYGVHTSTSKKKKGEEFKALAAYVMSEKEEGSAEVLKDPLKVGRSSVGHLASFISWARTWKRRVDILRGRTTKRLSGIGRKTLPFLQRSSDSEPPEKVDSPKTRRRNRAKSSTPEPHEPQPPSPLPDSPLALKVNVVRSRQLALCAVVLCGAVAVPPTSTARLSAGRFLDGSSDMRSPSLASSRESDLQSLINAVDEEIPPTPTRKVSKWRRVNAAVSAISVFSKKAPVSSIAVAAVEQMCSKARRGMLSPRSPTRRSAPKPLNAETLRELVDQQAEDESREHENEHEHEHEVDEDSDIDSPWGTPLQLPVSRLRNVSALQL